MAYPARSRHAHTEATWKDAAELSHVMWIGGSPSSGKSTISHTIVCIYAFVNYRADAFKSHHFARRVAGGAAEGIAFLQMNMDQRWLQLFSGRVDSRDHCVLDQHVSSVIEDLLALPKENLIVAEGSFFPLSVAPYRSHPHEAIWLTPTATFCDQARRRNQAELIRRQQRHGADDEGSNPEQRLRNLIKRDRRLADFVK